MYNRLGQVELRTGESLEAGVVQPPDRKWTRLLEDLLQGFNIGPWRRALRQLLHRDTGAEVRLYFLHRAGDPISTSMTVEHRGVGLRGNVWTRPAERRKGACSGLMTLQMRDFRARGGQALYLFTDYGSIPYRIYQEFGFQGVEPHSGHMAYYVGSGNLFAQGYFTPGETSVEMLDWTHVAAAHPLFMGDHAGLLRCASLGLVGCWSPEWPLVSLQMNEIERRAQHEQPRTAVLRNLSSGAVAGLATWTRLHAPSQCLLDLYCHPAFWDEAQAILEALELPKAEHVFAYADSSCEEKIQFLRGVGFSRVKCLRNVPVDWCRPEFGFLPRTQGGALLARVVSPATMALRRMRDRQGGTVNSTPTKMDLVIFKRS